MTGWVNLERSTPISRHISSLCSEASDSTYIRDADIRTWATLPGKHFFPSFRYWIYCFVVRKIIINICVSLSRSTCMFACVSLSVRNKSWLRTKLCEDGCVVTNTVRWMYVLRRGRIVFLVNSHTWTVVRYSERSIHVNSVRAVTTKTGWQKENNTLLVNFIDKRQLCFCLLQ